MGVRTIYYCDKCDKKVATAGLLNKKVIYTIGVYPDDIRKELELCNDCSTIFDTNVKNINIVEAIFNFKDQG